MELRTHSNKRHYDKEGNIIGCYRFPYEESDEFLAYTELF